MLDFDAKSATVEELVQLRRLYISVFGEKDLLDDSEKSFIRRVSADHRG